MSDIQITLASTSTGRSETIPVNAVSTTVADLVEWAKALLGEEGDVRLYKDGQPLLLSVTATLQDAGIENGDLLAVQQPAPSPQPAAASGASGGLDFSALLNSNNNNNNNHASATRQPSNTKNDNRTSNNNNADAPPVFYPGMSLNDAIEYNPHPQVFCKLLLSTNGDALFKELNYHNPNLAQKLKNKQTQAYVSLPEMTTIWRDSLVKGGIQSAVERTELYHKEKQFQLCLDQNPNDTKAKQYFQAKKDKLQVDTQYREMMQEYPESMGKVLMLYISTKVNGHSIQAFVDSGAQSTIMSKKCAEQCGVSHLIDTRFEGIAVGVGTGKILGRIHIVSLEISGSHFPCSVTVMDDSKGLGDKNMDFLLGLDMLKRHMCSIDLAKGAVQFQLAPGKYMEAGFLYEKDLTAAKGGTKGFNADKANQELLLEQEKRIAAAGADAQEESKDDNADADADADADVEMEEKGPQEK